MVLFVVLLVGVLAACALRARVVRFPAWPACLLFGAAIAAGALHLRSARRPQEPVLQTGFDRAVGFQLGRTLAEDLPTGGDLVVMHWRGDEEKVRGLEAALAGKPFRLTRETPPPAVPTGSSNEVMLISMKEAGVPAAYVADAARRHPDVSAVVVLLPLHGLEGLPSEPPALYLDEQSQDAGDLNAWLADRRAGAAVAFRGGSDWRARDALRASPTEMFGMRYRLMRAGGAR
jgi:hypothetical protein